MKNMYALRPLAVFLLAVAAAGYAQAQEATAASSKSVETYEPEVGQEGKDVVWVPTSQTLVEKMLDMAEVTSKDYVIDLGSGDGRTVVAAAKRGARALGIEYNPDMVELSKRRAAKAGVSDRASFVKADLFESDFSKATVITMFLLPDINRRLRPKILNLKPGTRIVSNTFDMEDWKPDETAEVTEDCSSYCNALFWIVPAKVAGTWELPAGTLSLTQTFQMVSGTLTSGTQSLQITNGKLRGNQLTFSASDKEFSGQVNGESIQGMTSQKWTARKKPQPTANRPRAVPLRP